jgi:hypothetical protein
MRLDLRFTNRPIEDLYCQAIVIFTFSISSGLSKVFKSIDRKMTGGLSNIVNAGLWSGECGEKLLFATQEAMKADKLLIYGLGDESGYSAEVLKREVYMLGTALDKMDINEFVFYLPVSDRFEPGYLMHLEIAIKTLANIYLSKYKDVPDSLLKMYISIDRGFLESSGLMSGSLRDFYSPVSDFTVIQDKYPWLTDAEKGEPAVLI